MYCCTAVYNSTGVHPCTHVYYNSTRVHRCTPILEVRLVLVVEGVLSIDVRVHTHMILGTCVYSRSASTAIDSRTASTLNLT